MSFIAYSFVAFALSWGLGCSKLTYDFRIWLSTRSRFLTTLVECVGCSGFHLGWIGYLLGARLFDVPFGPWWIDMAALAFYTCASNLIIGKWVGVVE